MVGEEVVALSPPAQLDNHKRQLDELEYEAAPPLYQSASPAPGNAEESAEQVAEEEAPDAKRVDDSVPEGLGGENGYQNGKEDIFNEFLMDDDEDIFNEFFNELESEAAPPLDQSASPAPGNAEESAEQVAEEEAPDASDAKRPRVDDSVPEGLGGENGYQNGKEDIFNEFLMDDEDDDEGGGVKEDLEEGEIMETDEEDGDDDDDVNDADIFNEFLMDDEDDDEGGGVKEPIMSKNELKVLPPVPPVDVTLQPSHKMLHVAFVSSVLKSLLKWADQHNPLSEGSILWMNEKRSPLGRVDEIFGPVKNPYYIVRYNSESEVPEGIHEGILVSFVPEFVDHVLNNKNLYQKGYDASIPYPHKWQYVN